MSEITEFTDTVAPAPAPMPSFWEDVIEIFIHPADVLRRRKDAGMWAPLLFVALTIGIISFATFNTLQPVFEAEFTRNTAKAIAQNPAAAEQMNKFKDMSLTIGRYTLAIIMVISIMVTGVFSWIVSRVVGAKSTFGQMMTIAAWAYFPRILSSIAGAIVFTRFPEFSRLVGARSIQELDGLLACSAVDERASDRMRRIDARRTRLDGRGHPQRGAVTSEVRVGKDRLLIARIRDECEVDRRR